MPVSPVPSTSAATAKVTAAAAAEANAEYDAIATDAFSGDDQALNVLPPLPPAPTSATAAHETEPSPAAQPTQPAHAADPTVAPVSAPDDRWRQTHLGRLLGNAMRRFDERVLQCMARDAEVPLALSNLAARGQISAAHVHITRHLDLNGSRLTDLAAQAGMTKQAMGDLVTQCEAWGLVRRCADPVDARARRVVFTADGLAWLQAFQDAVAQAEAEFRAAVGYDVATVAMLGLEAYAA